MTEADFTAIQTALFSTAVRVLMVQKGLSCLVCVLEG